MLKFPQDRRASLPADLTAATRRRSHKGHITLLALRDGTLRRVIVKRRCKVESPASRGCTESSIMDCSILKTPLAVIGGMLLYLAMVFTSRKNDRALSQTDY